MTVGILVMTKCSRGKTIGSSMVGCIMTHRTNSRCRLGRHRAIPSLGLATAVASGVLDVDTESLLFAETTDKHGFHNHGPVTGVCQ